MRGRESKDEEGGSLRTGVVNEQLMQVGLGRREIRGQTEPMSHLFYHGLQKLGPSGVFEGELVGVYFKGVSDGGVDDGLSAFAKGSLSGGGLDELGVTLGEREANETDALDVQTGEGRGGKSLAEGEFPLEVKVAFEDFLEVILRVVKLVERTE